MRLLLDSGLLVARGNQGSEVAVESAHMEVVGQSGAQPMGHTWLADWLGVAVESVEVAARLAFTDLVRNTDAERRAQAVLGGWCTSVPLGPPCWW